MGKRQREGIGEADRAQMMHNKLKQKDDMHSQGGLAADEFKEDTAMSATNATLFGQSLSKQRVQWMDGIITSSRCPGAKRRDESKAPHTRFTSPFGRGRIARAASG